MFKQSFPYIVAGVVLVLLYSLLGYPLLRKNNEAEKMLMDKLTSLDQIYSSSNLPSDELITAMEKDSMKLTDKYTKLREKLPIAKELSLPKGVNLPLFFLEELKNAKEKLKTKAKEKGVKILTEDLGLPNTLPSDKEAPVLIKNLYITKMIANLLIEVGVDSIDDIKVGGAGELGRTRKTDMYEDIPLSLTVNCNILSLTNLLFTLENTDKGFFIVRDFSLVSNVSKREIRRVASIPFSTRRESRVSIPIREETEAGTTETKEEKNIQANLELSVIRWL